MTRAGEAPGLGPDDLEDFYGCGSVDEACARWLGEVRLARAKADLESWDEPDPDTTWDPDELLGPEELAGLLGVGRSTVRQWRHRGHLPECDQVISGLPLWRRDTVWYWAVSTGRWPDGE